MKKIWIFMFALLAIVSCKDDDPKPATAEQLQKLTGHWYAELPANGETANWRTLEEGDMTNYDHIGVVIYLNGNTPTEEVSYWGYLYLQNGDLVNFAGLMSETHEQSSFSFTMDEEYNITPSSHLKDAPKVTKMHYDREKDIITAEVFGPDITKNAAVGRSAVTLSVAHSVDAELPVLCAADNDFPSGTHAE